jgi:peptide-methionine (R)-S-oxide reductase
MGHVDKAETQWQCDLTPEQYQVLREEGTERRFTSPLNSEYRKGVFVCAGCGEPLFKSEMKCPTTRCWIEHDFPFRPNRRERWTRSISPARS